MIDSKKIDDFFSTEEVYEIPRGENRPRQSMWLRFIKLAFPCIAAVLLGLMIVVPNIRKSVDLKNDVTIPRKNEMEKLHIEETVFHATDDKNRINKVIAESIDETAAGTQKFKINKPRGQIPTDRGVLDISATVGYFMQNGNILELQDDVLVLADDGTKITTAKAIYDFNKEYGHGNNPVQASGKWGKLKGESFSYDKKNDLLLLKGNSILESPKGTLSASKKTYFYRGKNKIIAIGNARISQKDISLRADKIAAYFTDDTHQTLQTVKAYGHVLITTPDETATGAEGYYDASLGKIELFGNFQHGSKRSGYVTIEHEDNVLRGRRVVAYFSHEEKPKLQQAEIFDDVFIETPKGTAQGKRGIYNQQNNNVELFEEVQIEQDGNFIKGAHAVTDLVTSVSRITGDETTGGRISGTFYKRKKQNGNQEKK